ncbi:hypothetical protein PARMER_03626 [Parabacteroides merdae ATCC 43184]|nr:hypothetical protein PARMER_03626 [Parabacteroides merdae ATCC 43184]
MLFHLSCLSIIPSCSPFVKVLLLEIQLNKDISPLNAHSTLEKLPEDTEKDE